MKEIAVLAVLFALCIPTLAVDMPHMVGNWTGTSESVAWHKNTDWQTTGKSNYWEQKDMLVIEEQNGTRFTGKIIHAINPMATEIVLGVIGSDNESIALVDEDGSYWGRMVSPTKMELFYQRVDINSMVVEGGVFTKK